MVVQISKVLQISKFGGYVMKKLAIGATILAALAVPAFAADMPVKAPAPPPPVYS